MEGKSTWNCSTDAVGALSMRLGGVRRQLVGVNGLMVANAMFAGIMVGFGAYGPRYSHHAFVRFLFQGANALFLPIISYVVSNATTTASTFADWQPLQVSNPSFETVSFRCGASTHVFLTLLWAGLVQIVGIHTCAQVAADDREGRNTALSMVLLVQAIWIPYLLIAYILQHTYAIAPRGNPVLRQRVITYLYSYRIFYMCCLVFALNFARLMLQYTAFHMAQRSFALGRNPRLVAGYMEQLQLQLQEGSQHLHVDVEHSTPPLLVMGEETQEVEKQPHGYCFRHDKTLMGNNTGLVTLDKIWQLDDMILTSIPRLKYVCFSFALFKLLRGRFAGYTVAEMGSVMTRDFFWNVLLMNDDQERPVGVITDELSFLHDYYYSSLPISYSEPWLPILSILISLLTIGSCCMLLGLIASSSYFAMRRGQISCLLNCNRRAGKSTYELYRSPHIGNLYFDIVPATVLALLVVLAEVKDIASYICSNWTKVALMCRYVVDHDTWQRSPRRQKWVGRLLRCRCNLLQHWQDKMNQCSILELHPSRTPMASLLRHLIPGIPDQQKNIKVPSAVKAHVVDALRSYEGSRRNGVICLPRSLQPGGSFHWVLSGKGTAADTMLVCHIATAILEVRYPNSASDHKVAATHLSRYCAYLVGYSPELLPGDDAWCKSLYKHVKKDAERVLGGGDWVEAEGYGKLVALLSGRSEHDVLKKGVSLGEQLVESPEGEEAAWRMMAGFWSEMVLYAAPSGNLDGHAEAIARGGELITVAWALLMHAGISTRSTAAPPA